MTPLYGSEVYEAFARGYQAALDGTNLLQAWAAYNQVQTARRGSTDWERAWSITDRPTPERGET